MTSTIHRPQYRFYRMTHSWRFWAFGYHHARWNKHLLLTIGFGPLRFQFIDWTSK